MRIGDSDGPRPASTVARMDGTTEVPRDAVRHVGVLARVAVVLIAVAVAAAAAIEYSGSHPSPWKRAGPPITVSGWAPYWQPDAALESFTNNAAVFSDVSMFAYSVTGAASVAPYPTLDPNAPLLLKRAADAAGVEFIASIIDDTKPRAMAAILADPNLRALHVRTVVDFVVANGFAGVDLDYENFAFNDGRDTWATTRPNWVAFLTEVSVALHAQAKSLTVSVPPVYDDGRTDLSGYWVYDYAAMGSIVDHVRVMAYDFSTSEPGPIAPLEWVTELAKAVKDLVPLHKILLGVPVYGYDWVTGTSGLCPADQPLRRRNLSTKSATALAVSQGIVPVWDAVNAESTFDYVESVTGLDATGVAATCNVRRTVWFADARAVHARAWVAQRQDLAGISLWSLGSDDTQAWEGIAAARRGESVWPPPSVTAGSIP